MNPAHWSSLTPVGGGMSFGQRALGVLAIFGCVAFEELVVLDGLSEAASGVSVVGFGGAASSGGSDFGGETASGLRPGWTV